MSATTQLDAMQVIKKVYDDASGAFSMVPAHSGPVVLASAIPANADSLSSAVNILAYKVMGVMVNWSGLAANISVQFQGSVDGTIYTNIGTATTLAAAAGAQDFGLIDEPYTFIKVQILHGSNTTGTVSIVYMLRA